MFVYIPALFGSKRHETGILDAPPALPPRVPHYFEENPRMTRLSEVQIHLPFKQVTRFIDFIWNLAQVFKIEVQQNGGVLIRHQSGSVVHFSASGDVRIVAAKDVDLKGQRFIHLNRSAPIALKYRRAKRGSRR